MPKLRPPRCIAPPAAFQVPCSIIPSESQPSRSPIGQPNSDDSRDVYTEVQEPLLRGFVARGLLRAPATAPKTLALAHGADDPDGRRLGALALAVRVHPLDELALLLHVLVEQREVPDVPGDAWGRRDGPGRGQDPAAVWGRDARVVDGRRQRDVVVATVEDRERRLGVRGQAVLHADDAVRFGQVGAEKRVQPGLRDIEAAIEVNTANE